MSPQCPEEPVSYFHVPHGRVHDLKTWPMHFKGVVGGTKRFEIRRADRPFAIDDVLLLREWDPKTQEYTGRGTRVRIASILQGEDLALLKVESGWCIMSIEPVYSAPMHCPCCGSEWQCPRCPIPEQLSLLPGDEELAALDAWRGNKAG